MLRSGESSLCFCVSRTFRFVLREWPVIRNQRVGLWQYYSSRTIFVEMARRAMRLDNDGFEGIKPAILSTTRSKPANKTWLIFVRDARQTGAWACRFAVLPIENCLLVEHIDAKRLQRLRLRRFGLLVDWIVAKINLQVRCKLAITFGVFAAHLDERF